MSRICGFVINGQSVSADIHSMTRAVASAPNWNSQIATSGQASMGWTGVRAPVVFDSGEISAVVDGCFFNRADLPHGENDA